MDFGDGLAVGVCIGKNKKRNNSDTDKWTRPSDWPQLGTPTDNQIIMLVTTQWNTSPYEAFSVYSYAQGDTSIPFGKGKVITVDWGDGTIENLEPWHEYTNASFGHSFYSYHDYSPPTWNDGPVLNSGAHVFVITITLPNGVYFKYNRNCELLDIHIGTNVKFYESLSYCHMLEHIKLFGRLPNGDNYDSYQFANNGALCSVETTIPFTKITGDMFKYCYSLHEIDLSQCVTIGNNAFYECNMENINAPLLETIGESAFERCNKLATVELPKLVSVGKKAFYICNIEKINTPLLETVGESAFSMCYSLKTVESPRLTNVGNYAFENCYSLVNISHADGWTLGSQSFRNCLKYYDNPNKSHPNYA